MMKLNITFFFTVVLSFCSFSQIKVNIADFGGIADGMTNNNQAITNAINHLNILGGGVLEFGTGEYVSFDTLAESSVLIRNARNISFVGNQTILKGIYGVNSSKVLFYFDNLIDCTFSDIIFSGEYQIDFDTVKTEYFNPRFNMVTGFNVADTLKNVTFENCDFKYFGGVAFNAYGVSENVKFSNCGFVGAIKDLSLFPNIQPCGILFGGNNGHTNIKIQGCNFSNFIDISGTNNAHGIYLKHTKFADVTGNSFFVNDYFDVNFMPNGGIQIYNGVNEYIKVDKNSFVNTHNYLYSTIFSTWSNNSFEDSKIDIKASFVNLVDNDFSVKQQINSNAVLFVKESIFLTLDNNTFRHYENASQGYYNPIAVNIAENCDSPTFVNNEFINFRVGVILGSGTANVTNFVCSGNNFYSGKDSFFGIDLRSCINCSFENNRAFAEEGEPLLLFLEQYKTLNWENVVFQNNKNFGTSILKEF